MSVPVDGEGRFEATPAPSKAGDRLVLKVLMDVVVALSACPQDINPANGQRCTDKRLIVKNAL